jgi:hypothetical protein
VNFAAGPREPTPEPRILFSQTFATRISLDENFPAPSPNPPMCFGRIVLSVLLLFAVLDPTSEGQEDLH